jgi:predicted RNA-binding protein YlqC (UPF0109 family)
MAERDQEFLEYIVGEIVDNPDDVKINRTVDERGVLLELTVNPDDMGKIIGKAGATAKAIRTLLRVMGAKHDARYNLKIVEPGEEGSTSQVESSLETNKSSEEATAEDIKSKAREGLEDLDVEI